jgi:hypothetical protein
VVVKYKSTVNAGNISGAWKLKAVTGSVKWKWEVNVGTGNWKLKSQVEVEVRNTSGKWKCQVDAGNGNGKEVGRELKVGNDHGHLEPAAIGHVVRIRSSPGPEHASLPCTSLTVP